MTTTDFFIPRSAEEAVALLGQHGPDLVVMGGGTIVMGLVNDGLLFPRKAMSLRNSGMDGVRNEHDHVVIGAAASLAQLSRLDTLPIVAQAAGAIGSPAIRTLATIGGNLFAEPPAGDMAVPLLALDTLVELAGPHGRRLLPLDQFFTGRAQTARQPDELLVALHVPRPQGHSVYTRMGRRQANTPAVVAVAAHIITDQDGICTDARIALGAAGPHPLRIPRAEMALVGRPLDEAGIADASAAAQEECEPFTDALASAWYRRKMVGVFLRRTLEQVMRDA